MGVTIKDIANETGVSIATVSHALNKTRYVSPELTKKIEKAALDRGYIAKHEPKLKGKEYRMGKMSEIALVIPTAYYVVYTRLFTVLSKYIDEEGYLLSIYLSDGNLDQEKHIVNELLANRRIAGVIIMPISHEVKPYEKLIASQKPFIFLERRLDDDRITCIYSDNRQGVKKATEHLIKFGHENIALIVEDKPLFAIKERENGYRDGLIKYNIPCRDELIVYTDLEDEERVKNDIKDIVKYKSPTALLIGGNNLTLVCFKAINEMGIECPKDISIVGFGDNAWCELVEPTLTTLTQNTKLLGEKAVELLFSKIKGIENNEKNFHLPMDLTIHKSTQYIARGPFGEKSVYPDENFLTEKEEEELRKGNYTVGISFHYTGNEWSRIHEKAIKDTLSNMGVRVLSVADANFEPDLQNIQLEGLAMQKPDAIIAVPTDEEKTSEKFKEISKKTKLVLINNMPIGLEKGDYSCWISVNERENGQNAAKILIKHFENQEDAKIGMLIHGTPFFATKQRDFFAEQTFKESKGSIKIVSIKSFYNINNAYAVCREMFHENPEIQGLYITWERPALQAIRALEDLGRTDVAITTTDLDHEIASYMSKGKMVVGLSSQRPFYQGTAVAIATAKALLGNNEHPCIGVPPYTVTYDNLEKAWKEILRTKMPDFSLNY